MKKRIHRLLICCIFCFCLFFSIPSSANENEASTTKLTVAFPETEGVNEIYDNGTYGGTTYDFLMEISKYTGWEYEFITGDPGELLGGMMNGEYDLMGGMFYQESFEEYFNYPNYVMSKNYSTLLCRNDNQIAKRFDLSTLNGMKIGVYSNAASKIKRLEHFLLFNNLSCELVTYNDVEAYKNCLENKEVDLMLGSIVDVNSNYNIVAQFESDPYYIITAKNKPELTEQLSAALTEIYSTNPNFADELYNKYFPDTFIAPIDFSKADKEFIKNAKTIRVAIIKNQYPVYYERDGQSYGIVPDLFELITKRTSLDFEFIPVKTYQQVIDMVKNGDADIAGCYMDDSYAADALGLSLTKNYASLNAVILKNKTITFPSDELTIAVPTGCAWKNTIENETIQYYDTYEACLDAVDSGKADFMRIPSAFIESLYLQDYYPNIVIIATDTLETPLSLALSTPINIDLYSVLNKSINNLSKDEINDLLSRNLISTGERTISLKSFIYANPTVVITISIGFFLLLSIIVLLSARYKLKNKVMQIKMEKVQETSQAKSEFLSRMSHEIRTPMNAIIGLTSLTQMSCELTPETQRNLEKINTSAQFLLSLVNDILDMSKIDSSKMKIEHNPFDLELIVNQMENIFTLQAQQNNLVFTIHKKFHNRYLLGDEIRIKQVLTNLLSNACKFTDHGGSVTLSIEQMDVEEEEEKKAFRFSVKDTGTGINQEDIARIFDSFEQISLSRRNTQGTGLGLSISRSLVSLMGGELNVISQVDKGSEFYFTLWLPICESELLESSQDTKSTPISLDGLHILLAEDNDLNAEIAISILELKGVTIERAVNGQQAVEYFLSHPPNWFQLILMDIQMPIKDGLTACAEIRAQDRSDAKNIPIIAMTANTFQEDRENAAAAGMSSFIPKPFNVEQLYQVLYDFIS